jgi:hypothetical protein
MADATIYRTSGAPGKKAFAGLALSRFLSVPDDASPGREKTT